jgi:hypothetical protein
MDLRFNINKIHSDVSSSFDNVEIVEKSDIRFGKYFEMSIFKEGLEVKSIIPFVSISNSNFNWSYYSNPTDNNSHLVERISNLNTFMNDVKDIFEKSKFDSDYLENKI